jgi:16S rRNA (guanine966-N2)-methyltransferase
MRIIAGRFKKSNLFSVPGNTARPTTDYTREVVFSVLGDITDQTVLDLYAGSGSLGLEALSRGASFTNFVEFSEKSIRTILRNMEKLHCSEECKIHRKKVSSYIKTCPKQFDLILMDPPYEKNLINKTIELCHEFELLKPEGKIVVEHSAFEKLDDKWSEYISYDKNIGKSKLTVLSFK